MGICSGRQRTSRLDTSPNQNSTRGRDFQSRHATGGTLVTWRAAWLCQRLLPRLAPARPSSQRPFTVYMHRHRRLAKNATWAARRGRGRHQLDADLGARTCGTATGGMTCHIFWVACRPTTCRCPMSFTYLTWLDLPTTKPPKHTFSATKLEGWFPHGHWARTFWRSYHSHTWDSTCLPSLHCPNIP